jgi:hypothetical protein
MRILYITINIINKNLTLTLLFNFIYQSINLLNNLNIL